jgi:cysteine synthase
MERRPILGPTFEEMLHPETVDPAIRERALAAESADPLDPINLFNIRWRDADGSLRYYLVPPELTGVRAPIAMMYSRDFPTGSHKVGAAYSVLMDMQLEGAVDPEQHTLVWPSTGNYGIGGAWVGCRMGYDCLVILPEEMSDERFQIIERYGARVTKTPGCESNVKEIYDECDRLRAADPNVRVLNQFEVLGNYRFHYHVTGNSAAAVAEDLAAQGVGDGRVAAFVSSMGSGGTIAAGDRLKQLNPEHLIVGLEPTQCPTLFANGYGGHDIQGIGDKHVTWIHNVRNMDLLMCIDDMECKKGLQVLTDPAGSRYLRDELGIADEAADHLARTMGISGVCNLLGAIKTAKFCDLGPDDVVVTVATDAIDRYHSVMGDLDQRFGDLDAAESRARQRSIFAGAGLDWIQEGTRLNRARWHNLKYYTWVEQQGRSVEELDAQKDPAWWRQVQDAIADIDQRNLAQRPPA